MTQDANGKATGILVHVIKHRQKINVNDKINIFTLYLH